MNEPEEQFKYLKRLAKWCRDAQKKYFRTRSGDDLAAAQKAEKTLDEYLANLNDQQQKISF